MFNSFKFLNERYMSNFSSKSSLTSFTSLLLQDISLWTSLLHCFTLCDSKSYCVCSLPIHLRHQLKCVLKLPATGIQLFPPSFELNMYCLFTPHNAPGAPASICDSLPCSDNSCQMTGTTGSKLCKHFFLT